MEQAIAIDGVKKYLWDMPVLVTNEKESSAQAIYPLACAGFLFRFFEGSSEAFKLAISPQTNIILKLVFKVFQWFSIGIRKQPTRMMSIEDLIGKIK